MAVIVSCMVAWRKPYRGLDPDMPGCVPTRGAEGRSVGTGCNKWTGKVEQNRKR